MDPVTWEIADKFGVGFEFQVKNGLVVSVSDNDHQKFIGKHIEDVVLD